MFDQVLLHVVTVDLGAAEDDGLVHLMLLDGLDGVFTFQDLDGFGPHFCRARR